MGVTDFKKISPYQVVGTAGVGAGVGRKWRQLYLDNNLKSFLKNERKSHPIRSCCPTTFSSWKGSGSGKNRHWWIRDTCHLVRARRQLSREGLRTDREAPIITRAFVASPFADKVNGSKTMSKKKEKPPLGVPGAALCLLLNPTPGFQGHSAGGLASHNKDRLLCGSCLQALFSNAVILLPETSSGGSQGSF